MDEKLIEYLRSEVAKTKRGSNIANASVDPFQSKTSEGNKIQVNTNLLSMEHANQDYKKFSFTDIQVWPESFSSAKQKVFIRVKSIVKHEYYLINGKLVAPCTKKEREITSTLM